jgi:hypothetical protein
VKSIRRTASVLTAATAALGTGFFLAVPGSSAAPAVRASKAPLSSRPGPALFDVGVHSSVTSADIARLSTTVREVPHFTATVKDGTSGHKFTYTMIGKNPAKVVTNATATVKTYLVPLAIDFQGSTLTYDPTVGTNCDSAGKSALTRTTSSPIFKSQAWTWGGTSIGTGQVDDAFQRANFWKYAGSSNPTFGLKLALKVLPKVTITVPTTYWSYYSTGGCGNGTLGDISLTWLDSYLQSTVIPSLAPAGVSPQNFPLFLVDHVVEYTGTSPSNCCVLGYHNAVSSGGLIQTYGLSMYDNTGGDFAGSADISALTHEVGEWTDDPYTTNPTDPWGHIGQVTGCQTNLEVGDPLSGTTFTDTLSGFTYHPQELAFFSWFYHQTPSEGVNGWYSDQGTFTSPAAACT